MKTVKVAKNSQHDESKNISLKVENILARGNFGTTNIELIQSKIFEALSGEKSSALALIDNDELNIFFELPQHLKEDKDIVKKSLSKNPKIYHSLSDRLQQDFEIQKITLVEMIQKSHNILEVISLIEKSSKNTRKIKKYIDEYIQNNNKLGNQKFSELVYNIYKHETELYHVLLKQGVFEDDGLHIGISPKLISFVEKRSQKSDVEDIQELRNILVKDLISFLDLNSIKIGDFSYTLLYQIIDCIDFEIEKEKNEFSDIDQEDESFDDVEESLSIGPYSYKTLSGTHDVELSDSAGNTLRIDETSMAKMRDPKCIENYMNFYLRMQKLGLQFLLSKYSNKIQVATEVDFFQGEGMSEARILKFLNRLGKRLGVPESSYEDADGNREVLCFQTLGAAYHTFREIHSSGKVGKYRFDLANIGGNSPVEMFLKVEGIIDIKSGDLSITSFREV